MKRCIREPCGSSEGHQGSESPLPPFHISAHHRACSSGHRKHSYSVFVLSISSTKICLWGEKSLTACLLSPSPPSHTFCFQALNCHILAHYSWAQAQWGKYKGFEFSITGSQGVSLPSILKELVQKKCASGIVGSLLSVRFFTPRESLADNNELAHVYLKLSRHFQLFSVFLTSKPSQSYFQVA